MVADQRSIQTVLIVEDEAPTREALASVFRTEGYRVVTAANRLEALHQLRGPAPADFVLLDLRQAVDGTGFLEERRRDEALAAVPVIVLAEPGTDRNWVASLGATAALAKPVALETLVDLVKRCG